MKLLIIKDSRATDSDYILSNQYNLGAKYIIFIIDFVIIYFDI